MVQWSRQQFHQEALQLIQGLNACTTTTTATTTSSAPYKSPAEFLLPHWTLERSDHDGTWYLKHPPIQREINLSKCTAENWDETNTNNDNIVWQEEDVSVYQDDPQHLALFNICPQHNGTNENYTTTRTTMLQTEWFWSIVYSDTWKAPILYFTVHRLHNNTASPCERSQVLSFLMHYDSHCTHVRDSWDMLSYKEHPITRIPSFFLHPCQTMERLEALVTAAANSSTNNNDLAAAATTTTTRNDPCLLLCWMSMILPTVGCPIPSKLYQELQRQLLVARSETTQEDAL